MRLYKFKNIKEYRKVQEETNKKKLHAVFVNEDVVNKISEYLLKNKKIISFGICHGTRRGIEQKLFSEKVGAKVIGTEISSTATQFPNTIQWDFHEVKDEWIGGVDFIYSNSIDHSFDPEYAISQWVRCLRDDGFCFIEYSSHNKHFSKSDCFSAGFEEMKEVVNKFGDIKDILTVKSTIRKSKGVVKKRYKILVIKKKEK